MNSSIRTILHPTDFSDLSGAAFAHALRIALAARCKLQLLHVVQRDAGAALSFPNVRRLLVQWGLSDEDDPLSEALTKLGLEVDNISLNGRDPAQSIVRFLREHPSDLIVIATHGRDGVDHWLKGSVSEDVSVASQFRRCSLRMEPAVLSVRSAAIFGSGACWFLLIFHRHRATRSKSFSVLADF